MQGRTLRASEKRNWGKMCGKVRTLRVVSKLMRRYATIGRITRVMRPVQLHAVCLSEQRKDLVVAYVLLVKLLVGHREHHDTLDQSKDAPQAAGNKVQ